MMEKKEKMSYFKYYSDNESVVDGVFRQHKLRFTQPLALNDPIEFKPDLIGLGENSLVDYKVDGVMMPNSDFWYRLQLITSHADDFGVLSLTSNPLSFDMWSHYGNGHRGFLVEFVPDFNKHPCMRSNDGSIYPIKQVEYMDKYEIDIQDLLFEKNTFDFKRFRDHLFFRKLNRWANEREFRMVRPLEDFGKPANKIIIGYQPDVNSIYLSEFPIEIIKSICFGASMKREIKLFILETLTGHDINYYQAFVDKNKRDDEGKFGKVELVKLSNQESIDIIKVLDSPIFTMPNALKKRSVIELSHYQNLPYFKFFPDLVKLSWENSSKID